MKKNSQITSFNMQSSQDKVAHKQSQNSDWKQQQSSILDF